MAVEIPKTESLTVEFKSDRGRANDTDLVAAAVCLANTSGGAIYIGVEDDGRITGVSERHRDMHGLAALITNRSTPSILVRTELIDVGSAYVAVVHVPKAESITATNEGLVQRRRLRADGTPECVPLYPHEFSRRQSDLRRLDYSALPVVQATPADLDPLERGRLRTIVKQYGGDKSLVDLTDDELDGAMGFVAREDGTLVPTVAGLLTVGRHERLRELIPTHEVAIQDLTSTAVRLNEFRRFPLLRLLEFIQEQFESRYREDEIMVGMFRVPIPNFDRTAFREGVVNALVHRDYTQLGAVHVRFEADCCVISNPGGFVEGVTLDNLLVTEPRPRNPLLADILKRLGLTERTGRGVDLIYEGMLRYGRQSPDYGRSSSASVVLRLVRAGADVSFLQSIIQEERRTNGPIAFDTLVVLNALHRSSGLTLRQLSMALQKDTSTTERVLGELSEANLILAPTQHVGGKFVLNSSTFKGALTYPSRVRERPAVFATADAETLVLNTVRVYDTITRERTAELCDLGPHQASRLLRKLAAQGKLTLVGERRGAYYVAGPNMPLQIAQ